MWLLLALATVVPRRQAFSLCSRSLVATRSFQFSRRNRHRVWSDSARSASSSSSENNTENGTAEAADASTTTNNKENSNDPWAEYGNRNNIQDQVVSAISSQGGIKVTVATVRNMVNDMSLQHGMTAVPSDAVGRQATCALLMANGLPDKQTVQITMNGDGPIRGVVTIAAGAGTVKGYVGSPMLGSDLTLQDAVGRQGAVQIVKNHPEWPRPYNGITAIRHGDIDRDIGIYLAESEQRSCALAAATAFNGLLCTAAGGYLIEQLPQVHPDEVARVEENLSRLVEQDGSDKLPTGLLLQGVTPLQIAEIILEGLDMQPLQTLEPKLVCECTEERLLRALRLLPRPEVDEILETQDKIQARCEFCGKVYEMGSEEVAEKLETATGDPSKD